MTVSQFIQQKKEQLHMGNDKPLRKDYKSIQTWY